MKVLSGLHHKRRQNTLPRFVGDKLNCPVLLVMSYRVRRYVNG